MHSIAFGAHDRALRDSKWQRFFGRGRERRAGAVGSNNGRNAVRGRLRDRHLREVALGHGKGRLPTDQGFDEWYGIPTSSDIAVYSSLPSFVESGVSDEMFVMESKRGEAAKKLSPYRLDNRPLIDRELTDRAISFMKREAANNTPFFLYLPYTNTHLPTIPHPDFAGKSGHGAWADVLIQTDSY